MLLKLLVCVTVLLKEIECDCYSLCEKQHQNQKQKLVFNDSISEKSYDDKANITIRLSPYGDDSGVLITCVNVTKLSSEESECRVKDGGVENTFVVLQFLSIGDGFNYEVQVYGQVPNEQDYVTLPTVILAILILLALILMGVVLIVFYPCRRSQPQTKSLQTIIDEIYA